jgi:hypothetical protein
MFKSMLFNDMEFLRHLHPTITEDMQWEGRVVKLGKEVKDKVSDSEYG